MMTFPYELTRRVLEIQFSTEAQARIPNQSSKDLELGPRQQHFLSSLGDNSVETRFGSSTFFFWLKQRDVLCPEALRFLFAAFPPGVQMLIPEPGLRDQSLTLTLLESSFSLFFVFCSPNFMHTGP